MTNAPICISCGMPMRTAAEHAAGDTTKDFCHHCSKPDGTLKSYEEVLFGYTMFLKQSQGLDTEVARETAKNLMAKMPAWSQMKSA